MKNKISVFQMIPHLAGAVVVVAAFILIFGRMSVNIMIYELDGGIGIESPDGHLYDIIYEDIEELKLVYLPETYGKCVDGISEKEFSYGTWKNESWGEYELCVKDEVKEAIWICTNGRILVFNFEGSQPTKELYEELKKKWRKLK